MSKLAPKRPKYYAELFSYLVEFRCHWMKDGTKQPKASRPSINKFLLHFFYFFIDIFLNEIKINISSWQIIESTERLKKGASWKKVVVIHGYGEYNIPDNVILKALKLSISIFAAPTFTKKCPINTLKYPLVSRQWLIEIGHL